MKISKLKLIFLVLIGLIVLITIWLYINQYLHKTKAASSTSLVPVGTYTYLSWPGQDYTNFEWIVTPLEDQTGYDSYFYSHQVGFVKGDAAYSGMQGDINGKRLVFSVFGAAIAGDGSGCIVQSGNFDGGSGAGTSCLLAYNWTAGRSYKFNLSKDSIDTDGTWWKSVVTDQSTNISTQIARIKIPASWGGLNGSVVWTERYGHAVSICSDIHYSSANFTNFSANNGTVFPTNHTSNLGTPAAGTIGCPGSVITDIRNGVRQEMGIGNPVPPIIQHTEGTSLSELTWTYETNANGNTRPVEKDKSDGDSSLGDGHTLTLNGQRFTRGLGAHAGSELDYSLSGQYSSFKASVGVDDEAGSLGSVVFQIFADGAKLFDSGLMTASSQTQLIDVDVTGKQELKLIVTDGGDGYNYDHADWADARLISGPATLTPIPNSTSLSLTLLLHGLGKGGDSVNPTGLGTQNPLRQTRNVKIEIFDTSNQLVLTDNKNINFEPSSGQFKATILLSNPLATGAYTIKLKPAQYLRALVPGIQILTIGAINQLPNTAFVAGDINDDNYVNALDYNILIDCYADLTPAKNCSDSMKKQTADLTDDGDVNQFDYNLFLRELNNISGE